MALSLYRKYRPQRFSEMTGQRTQIDLITSALSSGTLGHAYMFSGPRGCGKTTAARILAKAVNCSSLEGGTEPCGKCASCEAVAAGRHLDLVEIDAASNRSIDDIKALQENVGLVPLMGRMKLYILDEVHMLTREAFNALLKTLEEPPETAMFILATTDPQKVPVTIRSRCQHIPFHRISPEDIASRLRAVAEAEEVEAEDAAIGEIARAADGGLRDALTMAEQAIALSGGLTEDAVRSMMGGSSRGDLERVFRGFREDPAAASETLRGALERGADPERITDGLFVVARDLWTYSLWGERAFGTGVFTEAERAFIREEAPKWEQAALPRTARAISRLFSRARSGLKTDVFAGLLLFGVMSAIAGEEPAASAPAARAEMPPVRTQAPQAASSPVQAETHDRFLGRQMPGLARPSATPQRPSRPTPPPAPPQEERPQLPAWSESAEERRAWVDASPAEIPPELDALPTYIAAAMLWQSGHDESGAPTADTASAPKIAVDILRSARARTQLAGERAPSDPPSPPRPAKQKNDSPPEAETIATEEIPSRPAPQMIDESVELSPERIASILGADILLHCPSEESEDETMEYVEEELDDDL